MSGFYDILGLTVAWRVAPGQAPTTITLIEEAIYSKLTSTTAITNLVGTRIYPLQLPQNPTYPAIAYQCVSRTPIRDSDNALGLLRSRFQFDIYTLRDVPDQSGDINALNIAAALRSTLDTWRETIDSIRVVLSMYDSENMSYIGGLNLYQISIDFMITHEEL